MSKPAEKTDAETQAILEWWEKENPVHCPLCGCGDRDKVEVRYVEHVDWDGFWHTGDMFRCAECGAEGEYE